MYDLLFMYNSFIDKLPNTYLQFITKWHKCFPITIDTKVIAFNSNKYTNTTLESLYL